MHKENPHILDANRSNPKSGGPSFPLWHRLYRLAWGIVWASLGSWTPVPLFSWRRFLVNSFGGKIAGSAKIYPGVRIWFPRNLEMLEHSCLAPGVDCYCMAPVRLEKFALVSQRAFLCAGAHDVDSISFQLVTGPICIEEEAWVAAEAFIGPGVVVARASVIGARAVLAKNSVANGVYVGNPAKLVRFRKCGATRNVSDI